MIEVRWDGPIATLALARGNARNAVPMAGWERLPALIAGLGDARAVVLRSDMPGIFSAGADVSEFAHLQVDPDARTLFRHRMRCAIDALAALPMPVVAAVDGGCFGAAVALILAADLRIAGDGAQFAVTPARLGLGYPREDVARLAAQVGRGRAAELLFTGDAIDGDSAARIGLVERRAPDAGAAAAKLAARIAENAPAAIRQLKGALRRPDDPDLDRAFDAAFGGPELAEGLAAFKARRRAVFE
ncbi:enoyl-CoA hydratase/isomerase family protein [Sphingomonas sp. HT-1]|uniref:enoyl-CoA hydratase/isomerase family protein n=1 Tax=unclassified Sphingomonas TaxID=196159 RepID=UPI00030DB56B|nr:MULTISPECIES: enoyl-CoA hydratase/isomerase family protein [unclassified Sphingomonas]KTF67466.1 enoyl-CoA hydratase [Sphingomonas sp. WG]